MVYRSPAAPSPEVESLLQERIAGHSLPAPFYLAQEMFDLDVEAIFARHWLFSAVEAEVSEPGDYVTVDIGPYSVLILRDDDEEIRAFHNVCRHRGARLLDAGCGSLGNIVCRYHQWTYRTDGELIFAESQPLDFDRSRFGLKQIAVKCVAGLIFVCLSDDPPADFEDFRATVEPYLAPYDLRNTKVAHQIDLVEEGNWKLVMENNRECQHCDAAHPELVTAYFPLFGYEEDDITPRLRPVYERYQAATEDLDSACRAIRFPRTSRRDLVGRATGFQVSHLPLDGAGASFGAGGQSVCGKLMGSIPQERFGDLSVHLQPNSWFHFLSDHAVVFRALPVSPGRTVVRTTWLVRNDAEEGVDYDIDSLTSVWRLTNEQDRALVGTAQRGVVSPGYEPGPYSLVEDDVDAFVTWYVDRLRQHVSAGTASATAEEVAR